MEKYNQTLFISDLHLQQKQAHITHWFLDLLKKAPTLFDALYILGDLFESWIGDDDESEFNSEIITALKKATGAGLKIYFMHGNRDFLIGKKFLRETGCILINEEEKIFLYDVPILLMHGDTLCTQDTGYLKIRKILRHPILQFLFLHFPLQLRQYIAHLLRNKSRIHTSSLAKEDMDVTPDAVMQCMQKHNVNYLIHGHTHKPFIHEGFMNNIQTQRIVLGAWHDNGNALIWDIKGNKRLMDFVEFDVP